jgi:hypothetical protein
MEKIACCCCGAVRAEVTAEPIGVFACHCEECQRRTGSIFGVVCVLPPEMPSGLRARRSFFERDGQDGRKHRMRFCTNCGTTVYWESGWQPNAIGIAVGIFFDPSFPVPVASKHQWVALPQEMKHLERGDT